MFQQFRVEWLLVLGLTVAFTAAPGCALFRGTGGAGGPENAGFHRTATTSTNPVPLPVEIVNDISMIASGYNNPQDGVWKPVHPEVERKPATPDSKNLPTSQEQVSSAQVTSESTSSTTPAMEPPPLMSTNSEATRPRSGKVEEYKVRSGDTLMKISFEKFGNIYRWREIYNRNRERIPDFNRLTAGTILVIEGVEYVVITRNGIPYLIRRGDTLGKISGKVYGVTTNWRSIWKNNPELIKDPNKIYAGFTLYYVPPKKKLSAPNIPAKAPASVVSSPAAPAAPVPPSAVDSASRPPAPVMEVPQTSPNSENSPDSGNSWLPAQ